MKIKALVSEWQRNASEPRTDTEYAIRLPIYDAAKVAALAELFPGLSEERVLTDLLAAALDDLATSFSYEPGSEVAGYDEEGDPMYADAGLTPRFQSLTREHAERLKSALES